MKTHLLLSAVALSLAASPMALSTAFAKDAVTQSSPNAEQAPFDIQFLDTMTKHHRDGIAMFELAVDKAESQAVKDKAQSMLTAQEKEIPELKALRQNIQPDAPDAINMQMPGMMPMSMDKLQAASGMKFDHEFLQMTIHHHQGGIEMAQAALKQAKNEAVKDKAQTIIATQQKDIAELEKIMASMQGQHQH